ncbi:MAG: radical SAM protein [Thermoplasmata archaeon]
MEKNLILPKYPFRVEFEIIEACNLNCLYCYVKPFRGFIIPFKDLKYFFLKTKEINPFEVILVGGEPFLRNDIIEILELSSIIFNRVGISTNGTLLSSIPFDKIQKLKNLILQNKISLQISLDSINPEINNILRGSTEEVIKGLKTLEYYNIPYSIGIVVTINNYDDITNTIKNLIENFFYIREINLEILRPSKSLGYNYKKMNVIKDINKDKDALKNIYYDIKSIIIDSKKRISLTGLVDDCLKIPYMLDSFGFTTCTAGLLRATVLSNGDVTPCALLRDTIVGNLYKESWDDIWKRSIKRFLDIQGKIIGEQCQININP